MNPAVLVAIISASAALAVAALSYPLAKRRERESSWRKLKLDHYKEFVSALSGVVGRRSSTDSQARYSDAVNMMTLVAPPPVLHALYQFQDEIRVSNSNKSQARHDQSLTTLLVQIRRDVHPIIPEDNDVPFRLMDAPPPS